MTATEEEIACGWWRLNIGRLVPSVGLCNGERWDNLIIAVDIEQKTNMWQYQDTKHGVCWQQVLAQVY